MRGEAEGGMEQDVSFGRYRFDVGSGRLWAGAAEVRLTPKASAVLKVLVAHADEPVSKEKLFASVWNDTIVSDDALTSCIQELRKAFEDDPKQPRFIETRHRRGYRFVAPLSGATTDADDSAITRPGISSIAVLPFADMSPGRDQDYLCEGLAEELIHAFHAHRRPARGGAQRVIPVSRDGRRRPRRRAAAQRRHAARGQRAQGRRTPARDGAAD